MSSTARSTSSSSGLRMPASTIVHRSRPSSPTEEAGDLLERALRGRQADALRAAASHERRRAARASARGARRAWSRASAWISSTITASTSREDLARLRREHQVQRLGRGDQEVGRLAQHRRALASAGVSPVRATSADRCRAARRQPMPCSGARRFFSTSTRAPAAARCRRSRVVRSASGAARRRSRSSAQRNAASVLPEPVGAERAVARRPRSPASPGPAPPWGARTSA